MAQLSEQVGALRELGPVVAVGEPFLRAAVGVDDLLQADEVGTGGAEIAGDGRNVAFFSRATNLVV
jgi:hypothetical protein